jgi:hypothetical protein
MIEVKSKEEEAIETTTSDTWECYSCSLIFHEEWIASLHLFQMLP